MIGAVDERNQWGLEPEITYLNHAAYGACPAVVLRAQDAFREQMERNPARFFVDELEGLLDGARECLAEFLNAPPEDLALVTNPTHGISTILRSLDLTPGDELLTTDHAYVSCRNALEYVAERTGARVISARVPYPATSSAEVEEAVLSAATDRTRIALLDHITSPTALIFPIERLVRALEARGIPTLVDGAHAPGQVPVDLRGLRPAYYVGHCHKWLCAPKGAAFFYARADLQTDLVPLAISVGHRSTRSDRSRFRNQFDWGGTVDPSPFLCLPEALHFLRELSSGGMAGLLARNHALACSARALLCDLLGVAPPCPDEMVGSFFTLPLPDAPAATLISLRHLLSFRHRVEVAIPTWPAPPHRLLRIAAHAYNSEEDYARLAEVLPSALREELAR